MALLVAGPARADELFVVGNGIAAMTADEIKEVFLGEVQFAGTVRLLPVDNAIAQAEFQTRVLKMSPARYTASWIKKAFRDGANAPPVKGSDLEVIGFVKGHPGAVGYVSTPASDVQLIARF